MDAADEVRAWSGWARPSQLIHVLGERTAWKEGDVIAKVRLAAALSLLSATVAADGPLPPQQELRGIKVVYLDVRVYLNEASRPDLVPQPEMVATLADRVRRALTGAGIRIAEKSMFDIPQLLVWIDLARMEKAPGFSAVGTRIEYTDNVRLRRAPHVGATYQAALWSAHQTDLVVDSELNQSVETRVAKGVEDFLFAIRYAENPKAFWGKQ